MLEQKDFEILSQMMDQKNEETVRVLTERMDQKNREIAERMDRKIEEVVHQLTALMDQKNDKVINLLVEALGKDIAYVDSKVEKLQHSVGDKNRIA